MMFMQPSINPAGHLIGTPQVGNRGSYPLYGITAIVRNLDKQREALAKNGNTLAAFTSADVEVTIGDMPPRPYGRMLHNIILADSGVNSVFAIKFSSARVGYWAEWLYIRRVGDGWAQAWRVMRFDFTGDKPITLFTVVQPGFPLAKGEDLWNGPH
jgi:hypothetical protein